MLSESLRQGQNEALSLPSSRSSRLMRKQGPGRSPVTFPSSPVHVHSHFISISAGDPRGSWKTKKQLGRGSRGKTRRTAREELAGKNGVCGRSPRRKDPGRRPAADGAPRRGQAGHSPPALGDTCALLFSSEKALLVCHGSDCWRFSRAV